MTDERSRRRGAELFPLASADCCCGPPTPDAPAPPLPRAQMLGQLFVTVCAYCTQLFAPPYFVRSGSMARPSRTSVAPVALLLIAGSVCSVAVRRMMSCMPAVAVAGTETRTTTVVVSPEARLTEESGSPVASTIERIEELNGGPLTLVPGDVIALPLPER